MNIFTVLFTVQGKSVADNKYIKMAVIMIKSLFMTGTWNLFTDKLFVMADRETWDAFVGHWDGLIQFTHICIPRPATLLEGITRRYQFFRLDNEDVTTLYLDVDFICRKKFSVSLPPDTMAVYPEGGSEDPNYCGEGGWAKLDHPGLSAGFWLCRPGPTTRALMDEIVASIAREPRKFYTVEQPYFNAAITKKTPKVYIPSEMISFNGHGNLAAAHFINFAGEPGDDAFHYSKMIQIEAFLARESQMTSSHPVPSL